jgi:hypothetical protein
MKKVNPAVAVLLLMLGVAVSSLTLGFARTSNPSAIQVLLVLFSMGLVFYSSHPLGHLIAARAFGVRTEYFFLGRSDFRRLELRPMSVVGGLLPTIGTKLRRSELASLSPRRRGYVFGSGVIFSISSMSVQIIYVFISGFSLLAVVFALLFFMATLATEFLFSTQVGDLAKMSSEFKKIHSPSSSS